MPKLRGTVRKSDIEGGAWLLETADGDVYQLEGDITGIGPGRVEVEGKPASNMVSFQQQGALFRVSKFKSIT